LRGEGRGEGRCDSLTARRPQVEQRNEIAATVAPIVNNTVFSKTAGHGVDIVMSCRILGWEIEKAVLSAILKIQSDSSGRRLMAKACSMKDNMVCRNHIELRFAEEQASLA
jgi:hypothetical protein